MQDYSPTGLIIWLVFSVLSSVWCYRIAKRSGFNTVVAVLAGLVAPVLAILGYLYFGSKVKSKQNEDVN